MQALQRTNLLKLSHKVVLTPSLNDNFFFTIVTAGSFFRSLELNLRGAFLILGSRKAAKLKQLLASGMERLLVIWSIWI